MTRSTSSLIPLAVVGAFDRHNFGDLLFAHIAAAMLPKQRLIFVGLAERDMRPWGGHRVRSLARLIRQYGGRPLSILHAGGELLDCGAWEAAVMLQSTQAAEQIIRWLDADAEGRLAWAGSFLGVDSLAPYLLARQDFPFAVNIIYQSVGGVGLDALPPAMRAEVFRKLAAADDISVRDRRTHSLLAAAGLHARLAADPAVMTAECFGAVIRRHAYRDEVGRVRTTFPQGYIAVQFSAEFGDDATQASIAVQLDRIGRDTGCGIVFFRAGAAPWHDDIEIFKRVAARMHTPTHVFRSLHLWDICALIAQAAAYCGSSLHGRIVAMAFGLPRAGLFPAKRKADLPLYSKQSAYALTWDLPGMSGVLSIDDLADGMRQAMGCDTSRLREHAAQLAATYRKDFTEVAQRLS